VWHVGSGRAGLSVGARALLPGRRGARAFSQIATAAPQRAGNNGGSEGARCYRTVASRQASPAETIWGQDGPVTTGECAECGQGEKRAPGGEKRAPGPPGGRRVVTKGPPQRRRGANSIMGFGKQPQPGVSVAWPAPLPQHGRFFTWPRSKTARPPRRVSTGGTLPSRSRTPQRQAAALVLVAPSVAE